MGDIGPEQSPLTLSKTAILSSGGAKSDAHDAPDSIRDPNLAQIVDCWPMLPEHIKAAMKALVDAHQTSGKQVR
jgi:cellobiose-specific phosphotransferase system component IIA